MEYKIIKWIITLCSQNNTDEFIKSIRKALTELNVFKSLNGSCLEQNEQSKYIEETIRVIDSIIMQKYFSVIKLQSV